MAEARPQQEVDNTYSMSCHYGQSSPESPAASVLRQAIRGTSWDQNTSGRPDHEYVDPQSALGFSANAPFGFGMLSTSPRPGFHEPEGQHDDSGTHNVTASYLRDLSFSPCEEDAEGELDDSLASAHSFWETNLGDTTSTTVDSLDLEEPPVPLLGRDGTWKGIPPSKRAPAHPDLLAQQHRQESRPDYQTSHANVITEPQLPHAAPYQGLRRRHEATNTTAVVSQGSTSAKRQRRTGTEAASRHSSTPSTSRKKVKLTSKTRSKRPTSSKKAASSKAINAEDHGQTGGHASSESGSAPSSRIFSSPASSLGRYRLRRKESVPVLSLADLLTPPPSKPVPSSEEAIHGSADFQEEVAREPIHPAGYNSETRGRRAESNHLDSHHEEAEDGLVHSARLEPDQIEPIRNTLASFKAEPEEHSSLLPTRQRGTRTFPPYWEMHPDFPLLYQRYSVPSSVSPEVLEMLLRRLNTADVDEEFHEIVRRAQRSHGAFNKPRSILDLYTPRFVKGVGAHKVGMCPVCYEDGKVKFLKTKFSAYNYHLQNFHGISALTGLPFTPPSHFHLKRRPHAKPNERSEVIQGHCYSCRKWIDMQGPKETEVKVAEIFWWKHAQACHRKSSTPVGVAGFFVEDTWFHRVCGVLQLVGGLQGEVNKLQAGNK